MDTFDAQDITSIIIALDNESARLTGEEAQRLNYLKWRLFAYLAKRESEAQ